jgi:hypothetical protein
MTDRTTADLDRQPRPAGGQTPLGHRWFKTPLGHRPTDHPDHPWGVPPKPLIGSETP